MVLGVEVGEKPISEIARIVRAEDTPQIIDLLEIEELTLEKEEAEAEAEVMRRMLDAIDTAFSGVAQGRDTKETAMERIKVSLRDLEDVGSNRYLDAVLQNITSQKS